MVANAVAPQTVALEVLHGCNFGCTFCYLPEYRPAVQTHFVPHIGVTFDILHELSRAGVSEVYLLGGEPTLHPDFDLLCQRIAELGFPKRGLVTNGSLLTRQRIGYLKRLGFWVDVSIRAVDPVMHRSIVRRPYTLGKVMEGLLLLAQESVPVGIEIDCLPPNRDQIFYIVKHILSLGISIRHVLLHRIAPTGAAGQNLAETTLDIADYKAILSQAKAIHENLGLPIAFEDGLPLCLIPLETWDHVRPCECGHTLVTVDPSGNVRRCACHPETLGNLLEVPLETLWTEKLRDFRSGGWQPPACHGCSVRERCKGGCAVSSVTRKGYSGDVFASMVRPILATEPPASARNSHSQ